MTTMAKNDLIQSAKQIYESRLRSILEPAHLDKFISIEPQSGEYFLGSTMSEAIGSARKAHPDRLVHTMRIGHEVALHFGVQIQ